MKRWLLLMGLAAVLPGWSQVHFSENFESYTGQLPNSDSNNTRPFDGFSNPCDANPWNDPLWRVYDVWHGVPAWPNHQIVNSVNPFLHPDPFWVSPGCLLFDPFLAQPGNMPTPHSGNQMLWTFQAAGRTQFVNLSVASGGRNDPGNPLYDGAYYSFWFYDEDCFNKLGRSRAEFRAYNTTGPDGIGALIGGGLSSIPSLGPYDSDTEIPPDNRALSRKTYNIRNDAFSVRSADSNPRGWADFRQVTRSKGWHHAAIWLTGDGSEGNPREFTFVIDGITRKGPRPTGMRYTTIVWTNATSAAGRFDNLYFDDVEVGVGTPKAFSDAMFVGRALPDNWRNDANGYSDVADWILDIEIRDMNDNLLATVERYLPKKNPIYNDTDGTDDYTGLIGIPNLLPAGTYKFKFKLRDRHWLGKTVTLTTPSRGEVVMLLNGDVNKDGIVNDSDLLAVLFGFGGLGGDEDLNGDGSVDDADLLIVLFNFGQQG